MFPWSGHRSTPRTDSRRRPRRLCRAIGVAVACALVPVAAAQSCPSADPTADYNCPLGPTYLVPGWTDLGGWNQPSRYATLRNGDIDGDGKDELVIRGPAGIDVYTLDTTLGQWSLNASNIPLTDAIDWGLPRYATTFRLAEVNPSATHARQLVARGQSGVNVWTFTPGATPNTGGWSYLDESGPLSDATCFSNRRCWGDDPAYYGTFFVGDAFRFGRAVMTARGGDGLVAYEWGGASWTSIAPPLGALSDAQGFDNPAYYSSILTFPGVGGNLFVVARAKSGLVTFELDVSGGKPGVWKTVLAGGPMADASCFGNGKCWGDGPQYWSTLRALPLPNAPVSIVARGGDGLEVWSLGSDGSGNVAWSRASATPGPFADADGFAQPQYYETLRYADVTGRGGIGVIARTAGGIAGYTLNGASWTQTFASGQPQLSDSPWAGDPSYYTTLRIAHVSADANGNPSGPALLLGRGPSGLRTWAFTPSTATWARLQPYGSYPAIDAGALSSIDNFLGIASGTIRSVYNVPTATPTASQLQAYQSALAATCSNELGAAPPRFQSCTAPSGATVGNALWTSAVNQVIAELFWATQVVNRFATLGSIQTALFIGENSEFPSITADLKLGTETEAVVARLDYAGLFGSILEFLGALPVPGISTLFSLTADAIAIGQAATPTLSGSKPSVFDQTYAQIEGQIAAIQQETQSALAEHQGYVLGDYGLISTVGDLVSSQIWRIDAQAALSASRRNFTQWVYRGFLPAVWDYWNVSYCNTDPAIIGAPLCSPPFNSAAIFSFSTGYYTTSGGGNYEYADFAGLLPRQTPCHQGYYGNYYCTFTTLETHGYTDTVQTLLNPVTPACQYNPAAGTAWQYGNCTLGITAGELIQPAVWRFANYTCGYNYPGDDVTFSTCAAIEPQLSLVRGHVGPRGRGFVAGEVQFSLRIERPIALDKARVLVHRLAFEAEGAGELFGRSADFALPWVLVAKASGDDHATLWSLPGEVPTLRGSLHRAGDRLLISLRLIGRAPQAPRSCDDDTLSNTFLTTQLSVDDGEGPPAHGVVRVPWECVIDDQGRLRALRWPPGDEP